MVVVVVVVVVAVVLVVVGLLTYIEGVEGTHLHCIHHLVPCSDLGCRWVCRCFNFALVLGL